jgi:RNA polymerase sigma-70 factor (ECF subfamily)
MSTEEQVVALRRPDPPAARGRPGSADDAALLAAVPHDAAAFEAVYRSHVRRVIGFAVGRCSSAEDVADVVAQTFVRLLGAAGRYDPVLGRPEAYVLGIAANVVRDHHRRTARHAALVSRLSGRDLLDADDIERIDAAIDAARRAPGARRALAAVPPGERAVLDLVVDGRSAGQAADELGISAGAARTRLSRARRRVRDLMTTTDEERSR